jgi:hypothetical protein
MYTTGHNLFPTEGSINSAPISPNPTVPEDDFVLVTQIPITNPWEYAYSPWEYAYRHREELSDLAVLLRLPERSSAEANTYIFFNVRASVDVIKCLPIFHTLSGCFLPPHNELGGRCATLMACHISEHHREITKYIDGVTPSLAQAYNHTLDIDDFNHIKKILYFIFSFIECRTCQQLITCSEHQIKPEIFTDNDASYRRLANPHHSVLRGNTDDPDTHINARVLEDLIVQTLVTFTPEVWQIADRDWPNQNTICINGLEFSKFLGPYRSPGSGLNWEHGDYRPLIDRYLRYFGLVEPIQAFLKVHATQDGLRGIIFARILAVLRDSPELRSLPVTPRFVTLSDTDVSIKITAVPDHLVIAISADLILQSLTGRPIIRDSSLAYLANFTLLLTLSNWRPLVRDGQLIQNAAGNSFYIPCSIKTRLNIIDINPDPAVKHFIDIVSAKIQESTSRFTRIDYVDYATAPKLIPPGT